MGLHLEKFETREVGRRPPQLQDEVAKHGMWADLAIPNTSLYYGGSKTTARYHYLRAAVARDVTSLFAIDRTHDAPRGVAEIAPHVQVSLAERPDRLVASGAVVRYWLRQTAVERSHQEVGAALIDYATESTAVVAGRHLTEISNFGWSIDSNFKHYAECDIMTFVDLESPNQPVGLTDRLEDRGPIDQFLVNGRPPLALMTDGMDVHLFSGRFKAES